MTSDLSSQAITDASAPDVTYENDFIRVTETIDEHGTSHTVVQNGTGLGVAVLIVSNGMVLVNRASRYALGDKIWEIPRGATQHHETSLVAVHRIALDKVGVPLAKATVLNLGKMTPETALLNTSVDLYFCEVATSHSTTDQSVQWMPFDEVLADCVEGHVQDAFTCIALMRARIKGLA